MVEAGGVEPPSLTAVASGAYMLSPQRMTATGSPADANPTALTAWDFLGQARAVSGPDPSLLWRSSGLAGVSRRTSRRIRPREPTLR